MASENNCVELKLEGITAVIEWQHPTDDGWRVHLSIKIPGKRKRNLSGSVLMASERTPKANEKVVYGVIIPSLWKKAFSSRRDMEKEVINGFAGQLSGEKVEFYMGMPQWSRKRMCITRERYDEIKLSFNFLNELLDFETSFACVFESYLDWQKHINGISLEEMLLPDRYFREYGRAELSQLFRKTSRMTTEFLSMFRRHWQDINGGKAEQTPFFGSHSCRSDIHIVLNEMKNEEKEDIRYISEGLANLGLHAKPPVDSISSATRLQEDAFYNWMSSNVHLGYALDIRVDNLRQPTMEALKLKDNTDISKSISEGMETLKNLHQRIRDALSERAELSRQCIGKAMQDYAEKFDYEIDEVKEMFAIFKHYKGCEIHFDEKYIGLEWDEVTLNLQSQYEDIFNIASTQSEITLRLPKMLFADYKILLAGRCGDRVALTQEITNRGGRVVSKLSGSTDVVIAGIAPGKQIISQARSAGILILKLDAFEELIYKATPKTDQFGGKKRYAASTKSHLESIFINYGLKNIIDDGIYL